MSNDRPRKRLVVGLVSVALGTVVLLSCSGNSDGSPEPQHTVAEDTWTPDTSSVDTEPDPTPSVLDYQTSVRLMEAIYDSYPYSQQRDVCFGVNTFGHDWAVKALKGDLTDEESQGTNWDAGADYLQDRCARDFPQ